MGKVVACLLEIIETALGFPRHRDIGILFRGATRPGAWRAGPCTGGCRVAGNPIYLAQEKILYIFLCLKFGQSDLVTVWQHI
jgi:hypothetical protein